MGVQLSFSQHWPACLLHVPEVAFRCLTALSYRNLLLYIILNLLLKAWAFLRFPYCGLRAQINRSLNNWPLISFVGGSGNKHPPLGGFVMCSMPKLNYIFQNSLSCMFLVRMHPKGDSCWRFGRWMWSSSIPHITLGWLTLLAWGSTWPCNCCPLSVLFL